MNSKGIVLITDKKPHFSSVRVSMTTIGKLCALGKKGETYDDIIVRLIALNEQKEKP